LHRAQLRQDDRVLDLGSGNGQKARVLSRYLNEQGSYEGLDIVRDGIEWCRNAYAGFPNFRFTLAEDLYSSHYNPNGHVRAEKYRLPYRGEDFHLVFCASLFTHLLPHETENYVAEIARVLRPKGRLVLTAFLLNSDSLRTADQGSIKFPIECDGYRVANAVDPSWAVAIPEDFLRHAMERCGLRICEVTYGFWAGAPDLLSALQDCLIAVKR
jgi:SAM-dependent methyltransferase